ncbi:hypothetical protein LINPERHAP1_LOCUS45079 [Linum perenne]
MPERANLAYHNKVIDGTDIKRLISRLIDHIRNGIYITHPGSSKNYGFPASYCYIHFIRN